MGILILSTNATATAVNLTTVGTTDWATYNGTTLTPNNTLSGTPGYISLASPDSVASYGNDPRTISWTNGTPTGSGSNTGGIFDTVTGSSHGFTATFHADTTVRRAYLYLGMFAVSSTLVSASLSDSSASPQSYGGFTSGAVAGDGTVIIDYAANSAGQTLTVTWALTTGSNITVQALALGLTPGGGDSPFFTPRGRSLRLGTPRSRLRGVYGDTTSSGAGPLSGSGISASIGAAALAGTLAMSGSGLCTTIGAGNLTASLAVSGSGISATLGSGALTGTAGAAGSGVSTTAGSGALTGNAAAAGSGISVTAGAGALTGSGALAGSGISASTGTGNLQPQTSGAISGSGISTTIGAAALTGAVTLSGSGLSAVIGAGALTGTAALSGSGVSVTIGAGGLQPLLAGFGGSPTIGAGSLTGLAALAGSGLSVTVGAANLLGTATLAGSGISVTIGSGDLEPFNSGGISGSGISPTVGSGNLTATAVLSGSGISVTIGSGDLEPPITPPAIIVQPTAALLPGVNVGPPKTAIELERGYKYPWQATGAPIVPSPFMGSSEILLPGIAAAELGSPVLSNESAEPATAVPAIDETVLLIMLLGASL